MKEMRIEAALDKKSKGHRGGGHKRNYASWCRRCKWEYELITPKCLRCKDETILEKDRHEELMVKVGQYNDRKLRRQERRDKWDRWKKTKKIFWKKMATDYSKWDYFTDSETSEEEDKDPIVPENDPAFQAMKYDLDKRSHSRKESHKGAVILKKRANNYFKLQDYTSAVTYYTQALDEEKGFLPLYANRALSYIKLKQWK